MNSRRDFLKLTGGSLVGSYLPIPFLGSGAKPQWETIYLKENQVWNGDNGLKAIQLYNNNYGFCWIGLDGDISFIEKAKKLGYVIFLYKEYFGFFRLNFDGWKIMQKPLFHSYRLMKFVDNKWTPISGPIEVGHIPSYHKYEL